MTTPPLSAYIEATPLATARATWGALTLHHERHRGFTARPHAHAHGQLLVPLAGRMRLLAAGRDHALQPEWGAWVAPGITHAVTPLSGELEFVALDAPATWLAEALPADGPLLPLVVAQDAGLWLAGRLLAREVSHPATGQEVVLAGTLATLATLLARAIAPVAPAASSPRPDVAVWRAVDAILHGFAGPLTVEGLARDVGLSARQLERRFKAVVGVSPKQHLIAVRLQAAQGLLRATPGTVAEVAAATGFASASHLTEAFTRHVGVAPGAWRAAGG